MSGDVDPDFKIVGKTFLSEIKMSTFVQTIIYL